ncbi:MAG: response regulator [candidate division Zixibacteria bacterium]|nr:response regulator [candidate division Zixibacteria bacterium]
MQALLIVEDDDNLRKLYTQEFAEEGYRVLPAANGHEAMQVLEREKPDLAILDLVMPGADGIELLGRFVKQTPQIPVVLNTAYPVYRNNYLTWSADAYVIKSSDLSELKQTIRAVLDRNHAEADP